MQSYWDTPEGFNDQFVGAVFANDVQRAFDLLQKGVDPNLRDDVVFSGDASGLPLLLIALGASVHTETKVRDNLALVRLLLDHGAKIDVLGFDGQTPLMIALESQQFSTVQLLLERGADVTAHEQKFGQTALIYSVEQEASHPEWVHTLMNYGAEIDAQDHEGWSALMYAVYEDRQDLVAALLERGASVALKSQVGETALLIAEQRG